MSAIFDSLITDRTQADVDAVKALETQAITKGWASVSAEQRAAYFAGMKGAYCYLDLNRVGTAVATLGEMLNEAGIAVTVNPKTNWGAAAVVTEAQFATYLANVRALLTAVHATAELPTQLTGLTWQGANQIEAALLVVARIAPQVQNAYIYAGEALCGGF